MGELFTIGYAGKDISEFIAILKMYNIDCLVDVRSFPKSKTFPMYDFLTLKKELKKHSIRYGSMKECFGARREEKEVYIKQILYDRSFVEVVDFEKVYGLNIFIDGFNRIINGLLNYNICFLCSEKNPFDCHRAIMVSEYFHRNGFNITHIIDDKSYIRHTQLDANLRKNFLEAKSIFEKYYFDEIYYSGGGIFDTVKPVSDNVLYWQNFFSDYNWSKGIRLRNFQIGFKKGSEEDD